jgi:DNA-binding transcriptional ArsR family regulator
MALADPTRRAILSMLLEDDMAVTDVAAPLPMSLAAVSKHLAILAAAGLISQELDSPPPIAYPLQTEAAPCSSRPNPRRTRRR